MASSHFAPQKTAASLFGLGRTNSQQFTDSLSSLASGKLGFLRESHPEVYAELMGGIQDEMSQYRTDLDGKLPNGPYQYPDEELMNNLTQTYLREVMTSQSGRDLMQPELVRAFDDDPGNQAAKFRAPFTEGNLDLAPKKVL